MLGFARGGMWGMWACGDGDKLYAPPGRDSAKTHRQGPPRAAPRAQRRPCLGTVERGTCSHLRGPAFEGRAQKHLPVAKTSARQNRPPSKCFPLRATQGAQGGGAAWEGRERGRENKEGPETGHRRRPRAGGGSGGAGRPLLGCPGGPCAAAFPGRPRPGAGWLKAAALVISRAASAALTIRRTSAAGWQ